MEIGQLREATPWIAWAIFVIFSVGLLALFAWFVVKVYKGDIKLATAMSSDPAEAKVSLSKAQIFLWTIVMVYAWLYHLALDPTKFPELPSQALLLMGISGATYLGAKQIAIRKDREKKEEDIRDSKEPQQAKGTRRSSPEIPDRKVEV